MGGGDQMHQWVTAEPKIAFDDHVHLTDVGYQRWADALSGGAARGVRALAARARPAAEQDGGPRAAEQLLGPGAEHGGGSAARHARTVMLFSNPDYRDLPDRGVLPLRAGAVRRHAGPVGTHRGDGAAR
jgi:hypothetical protein